MHCTACGQHNHDDANFCGACGNALQAPPAANDPSAAIIVPSPASHDGTSLQTPPPAQDDGSSAPVRQRHLRIVAAGGVLLLIALVGILAFLVLSGDESDPPSQEALDEPGVDMVELDGTVVRLQVSVDFDGSVDNIALYGDGALVDQAANLGGQLVWSDPPEGRHDLILRAQKGDLVLIGAPTSIVVGTDATLDGEGDSATTTDETSPEDASPPEDTSPDTSSTETTPTSADASSSTTTTEAAPGVGPYVAVLASLPKSTVTIEAANQSGQNLAITFGLEFHRVIDSDNWASLRDGFWVIATSRNFETLDRAAAHCWELGATEANTCFGRPITQNPDDLTVVGVPAP